MRFTLTSISRKVLELDTIESVVLPTKSGEITILPNHSPLITALTPGILIVHFDGKVISFAVGGGVVETNGEYCLIAADMVEEGSGLNLEDIRAKKEEAHKLLEEARASGESTDMECYLEIEYEFLKESAKEQLATRE